MGVEHDFFSKFPMNYQLSIIPKFYILRMNYKSIKVLNKNIESLIKI